MEAVQDGEERAVYGQRIIERLSKRLNEKYKKRFSVTSFKYFRKFYQTYPDRSEIQHPLDAEFLNGDLNTGIPRPTGVELTVAEKGSPLGEEFKYGFVPR